MLAFPALLPLLGQGLFADSFTYEYTGLDFNSMVSEVATADYPQFNTSDNISLSITLNTPILSDGSLTGFTSDVVSYSISDGQRALTQANLGLSSFEFETTDGALPGKPGVRRRPRRLASNPGFGADNTGETGTAGTWSSVTSESGSFTMIISAMSAFSKLLRKRAVKRPTMLIVENRDR